MARLFKTKAEKKKSLWQRAIDLAFTDVRVLSQGMDNESLESLEERLIKADFGVPATLRLVGQVEERARKGQVRGAKELRKALRDALGDILASDSEDYLHAADVGLTVYLIDLGRFAEVNEIMAQYFAAPYPARAAIGVAALPRQAEVEVDAIMVLDD